ncbi:hypothetical protein ABEB36_010018 [Hypothenemus hampei]|uniref:SMP-LTD domain-containing protein n=1 Tax=Hypothenemus hampei TaxID=57062 RepID=A0ABD1EIR0_HYPHA
MDSKKCKPVTTSVPSISIKFHANVEEIEELRFSDDDTPNIEEKNHNFTTLHTVSSSASDQDSSPLKLFPKLVKRSTSVDVTTDQSLSSSPPSDPWRFFSDIKGKITKSVEDKITEIKAKHDEAGSPLHRARNDSKLLSKTEPNKNNSSFSDSEDQSESSISRTCGFASTTEGVEMSSDDETSSTDKEKKQSPSIIRQRFRFLKHHQSKEGAININNFSKLYNINAEKIEQALPEQHEEVESGVDALEETEFKRDISYDGGMTHNIVTKVAGKIDNIDVDLRDNVVNIREISGEQIQKSFHSGDNKLSTVFAPVGYVDVRFSPNKLKPNEDNVFPYILLSVYIVLYAIFHTYLPYMAGLLLGVSLALSLGYVYMKLYTLPLTTPDNKASDMGRIMEVPVVKEHQALTKYEGWVNEYPQIYDPAVYHISHTQSVFLRLQGNLLRISHSKSKVPKRAMWNEHEIKATFTHHRIYNLLGAKVSLLPEGLAKVRLWSKKYPICITLNKDQMNFDPSIVKIDADDESEEKSDSRKSPKAKKKFTFKKREYASLAQRFSKLAEDQDIDIDSDSRASTPSPEGSDNNVITPREPEEVDDESRSFLDDSSENDSSSEIKIYIFGRTDREKEDWFRRLMAATHHEDEQKDIDINLEYIKYMMLFIKPARKISKSDKNLDMSEKVEDQEVSKSELPEQWLNALLGRVLFDCVRNPDFTKKIQNRIQKKLQTIRLPYFIEEILITELNLGKAPPFILKTGKPVMDDRGLWVDLDISYEGSVVVTLQTKLNLMKLKNPQLNDKPLEVKSAIYHSDVDDTAESSSDEDGPQESPIIKEGIPGERPPPVHGSKKFIKMVDRIAESKFFQVATDNRYIKKAMEGVSNTELRLTVELKALSGTVVLNIPPPPSDRIWLGFRPVPELVVTACPIVGDRNVTYTMVTNWIEKKMLQEFQKVMVIPNMEDFLVSVMNPNFPD